MTETYSEWLTCANCGYEGDFKIPLGETIANFIITETCPHCKCFELVKRRI